jgi:hypothetical protein
LQNSRFWPSVVFALCLTFICLRAFQYPEYRTDGLSYMADVVAMHGASIEAIHKAVYAEAQKGIPPLTFNHLSGNDPAAPASELASFRDRAINPYHFAEYLPCFAVRPIFTELVYVLHYRLGIGLLKSLLLVPTVSYWLLGWLLLAWSGRYIILPWAALITTLLLLSPPLWDMARAPGPDALSTLVVLLALFFLLERPMPLLGTVLLISSVYIRTDNVIAVVMVLAYLWVFGRRVRAVEAALFSALALSSVIVINHSAGDYGATMMYYRGFIAAPVAVGEFVPRFGMHDYLHALKAGIGGVLHGPHMVFALIGIAAIARDRSRAVLGLMITTAGAAALHFIVFPLPDTRYLGPFFAAMGVALASISARSSQTGSGENTTLAWKESRQLSSMASAG